NTSVETTTFSIGGASVGATATRNQPQPEAPAAPPPPPEPCRELLAVTAKPSEFLSNISAYSHAEVEKYLTRWSAQSLFGHAKLGFDLVAPKDWSEAEIKVPQADLDNIATKNCQLAELDGPLPNTSLEVWFTRPQANTTPDEFLASFTKSLKMKTVLTRSSE